MKTFDQFLFEKNATYSFGCVMLDITDTLPNNKLILQFIKILQQQIPEGELYIDPKNPDKHGKETEHHVTLLFGLHPEVLEEDVKRIADSWNPVNVKIKGISIFENPHKGYDVVKLDVDPTSLVKFNEELKQFPYTNEYPEYKPHITLAYVLPGNGKKYELQFEEPLELIDLSDITYSFADKSKEKAKIKLTYKVD